ncbi:ATP-binding protein [Komagataeibacter sp. NFXK3]
MADEQAGTNGIEPVETDIQTTADVATWGDGAPRGGRAVMNRVLKDGAKVPMFFGQTLIRSLRDQGYSSITSALCEIIDNAIQWSAENIHIYFRQTGGRGAYTIDVAVLDDGKGIRLDRIIEDAVASLPHDPAGIARAVRSGARRARHRRAARRLAAHLISPAAQPDAEHASIWRQAWARFGGVFSTTDQRLLLSSETTARQAPRPGAERTRLSRLRSSASYRRMHHEILAIEHEPT